jgi:hypothetical protein
MQPLCGLPSESLIEIHHLGESAAQEKNTTHSSSRRTASKLLLYPNFVQTQATIATKCVVNIEETCLTDISILSTSHAHALTCPVLNHIDMNNLAIA